MHVYIHIPGRLTREPARRGAELAVNNIIYYTTLYHTILYCTILYYTVITYDIWGAPGAPA